MPGEATAKSAAGLYDKFYRKVFERAGIANGGSHRFRHLFAVSLLQDGADMRNVSRALGHSSIAVTEKYYASWDRKQQENLDKNLRKVWARNDRARASTQASRSSTSSAENVKTDSPASTSLLSSVATSK